MVCKAPLFGHRFSVTRFGATVPVVSQRCVTISSAAERCDGTGMNSSLIGSPNHLQRHCRRRSILSCSGSRFVSTSLAPLLYRHAHVRHLRYVSSNRVSQFFNSIIAACFGVFALQRYSYQGSRRVASELRYRAVCTGCMARAGCAKYVPVCGFFLGWYHCSKQEHELANRVEGVERAPTASATLIVFCVQYKATVLL